MTPLFFRDAPVGQAVALAGARADGQPRGIEGQPLPASLIQPTMRAGLPTTRAKSGTSLVTTAPAPTKAKRPMVWPQTTVQLAPSEAPTRTIVGL